MWCKVRVFHFGFSKKQTPRQMQNCKKFTGGEGNSCERKKNGNRSMWWESSARNKVLIHVKGKRGEFIQHMKDRSPHHLSMELPQILSPHCPLILLGLSKEIVTGSACGNNLPAGSLVPRILLPPHPWNALLFTVYPNPLHAEHIQ